MSASGTPPRPQTLVPELGRCDTRVPEFCSPLRRQSALELMPAKKSSPKKSNVWADVASLRAAITAKLSPEALAPGMNGGPEVGAALGGLTQKELSKLAGLLRNRRGANDVGYAGEHYLLRQNDAETALLFYDLLVAIG